MWHNLQRWRGVILIAAASVATVWLAFGNGLLLYIHPRYIVFTLIMAAIALGFVVAGALARPGHDGEDGEEAPRGKWGRVATAVGLVVASGLAIAMVALPPATLTSATADQRDINSTSVGAEAQDATTVASAPSDAFAAFTVVDWSSLLRQTNDLAFYRDKPVDVVGFITADPDDPQNVFYVSRFVVTCCAVDAQPAGVPVYFPNWTSTYSLDDWVEVTGEFAANPSSSSAQPLAVAPDAVTPIEQPSEPYLY